MKIYTKYIFKVVVPTFFTLSIVLTILIWITQILRMIHFIDKGIALKSFIKIMTLLVPSLLFMIFPVITVISVVMAYNRLQEENQLIVLKSSGVSNMFLMKPALFLTMLVTFCALYNSAYLVPNSYRKLKDETNSFQKSYLSQIIDSKTFNQISNTSTLYIYKKHQGGNMDGIIFFDNRIPKDRTIFFAKHGRLYTSDPSNIQFELIDGVRHSFDRNLQPTKLHFDKLYIAISNEIPDHKTRNKTSLELNLYEMFWPDKTISLEKQSNLIVDAHIRIIWPLFCFAFVFLALSIFLKQPHNKKTHIRQYIFTFMPILIISYLHFTLQKFAYKNFDYIMLCYTNLFICISIAVLLNIRQANVFQRFNSFSQSFI